MDPSYIYRPCLLSHPTHPHPHPHPHHHHHLFFCSHHHHLLHHHNHHHHHHHHHFLSHPHICPRFACTPQNPEPVVSVPLPNNLNMEVSACKETHDSGAQMLEEQEHEDKEDEEDEEDEEPVFVLTDEWMEFFAKSEAKRKLAKKQAKKKGKN